MFSSAHQRNVQRTVQSMQSGYVYGQSQIPVSPYADDGTSVPGYRQAYGRPRSYQEKLRFGNEVVEMPEGDANKFRHLRFERMKLVQNYNHWFPLINGTKERIKCGMEKESGISKRNAKHLADTKKKIQTIDEKLARLCKKYYCTVEAHIQVVRRR